MSGVPPGSPPDTRPASFGDLQGPAKNNTKVYNLTFIITETHKAEYDNVHDDEWRLQIIQLDKRVYSRFLSALAVHLASPGVTEKGSEVCLQFEELKDGGTYYVSEPKGTLSRVGLHILPSLFAGRLLDML